MEKIGISIRLVAKPGKEDELAAFLTSALPLAQQEAETIRFYVTRINQSTFGVFDTFEAEAGRSTHLNGPIAAALMEKAPDLLAVAPIIEQIELLAVK
jgi:quinol monooxygenase YgiN